MLAHRPGFVFPTLAAKSFATIDQIGRGRLGIHIISGGTDAEQRREGDYLSKAERYERSDEFIQIIRRVWSEDGPISHEGKYYKFEDFQSDVKPYQRARSRSPSAARRPRPTGWAAVRATSSGCGASRSRRPPSRSRPSTPRPTRPDGRDRGSGSRSARSSRRPTSWRGRRRTRSSPRRRRTSPPTASRQRGGRRAPRRTSGRSGCLRSRNAANCTTARCGRRWSPRPGRAGPRPRWSAVTRRWRRRCSTTSTSAASCSRSAAGTRSTTPSTTRATCCRSSGRNWRTGPPGRRPIRKGGRSMLQQKVGRSIRMESSTRAKRPESPPVPHPRPGGAPPRLRRVPDWRHRRRRAGRRQPARHRRQLVYVGLA